MSGDCSKRSSATYLDSSVFSIGFRESKLCSSGFQTAYDLRAGILVAACFHRDSNTTKKLLKFLELWGILSELQMTAVSLPRIEEVKAQVDE
jgi:hypothetical protein